MTTPAHRSAHLVTAILALGLAGLLGSGCADGLDPDDDQARMAVVFVADGGLVQTVGSYDIESGELAFEARAQRDMDTRIGDAGYRAFVADDAELSEVDLAAGVVFVAEQLDEGEELELRVVGDDIG